MKHFVIGNVDDDLIKEFFNDEVIRVEFSTIEDLFVFAGIFKSKGDCRKNGFSGEIPDLLILMVISFGIKMGSRIV